MSGVTIIDVCCVVCNVDLPSSSLPEAGSGPPGMEAQALSQSLQNVLSK